MTTDAHDPTRAPAGPRASAVAIAYDTSDAAPRVVAKGYGTVAENIMRTAHDHGLFVHESPELVGLLMQVDLDKHIPPELYQAVAQLLAWLYKLEGRPDRDDGALQDSSAEA